VQVHKFVCRGTLEERIDRMIEDKKHLARSIVGAGEQWIAGLSDDQLAALVALDADTAVSEGH
jgi:SNF2 family DNA or RNA helicase